MTGADASRRLCIFASFFLVVASSAEARCDQARVMGDTNRWGEILRDVFDASDDMKPSTAGLDEITLGEIGDRTLACLRTERSGARQQALAVELVTMRSDQGLLIAISGRLSDARELMDRIFLRSKGLARAGTRLGYGRIWKSTLEHEARNLGLVHHMQAMAAIR